MLLENAKDELFRIQKELLAVQKGAEDIELISKLGNLQLLRTCEEQRSSAKLFILVVD